MIFKSSMEMSNNLLEAHFCSMKSQSNAYGLAKLRTSDGMTKLLIATLRRKVYLFEYTRTSSIDKNLIPSSREIQFTYIPGAAEIISIDALNKSNNGNDFSVGISFIRNSDADTKQSQYLNIYSDWDPGNAFNLDSLAQSCFSLELDFVPYQLTHTDLNNEKNKEKVWLLSGSDYKVHVYREEKLRNGYSEEDSCVNFPEFNDLPSVVLVTKIVHFHENGRRLTVFGCENGYVRCVCVDTVSKDVVSSSEIQHDSPITSIVIFTKADQYEWPAFLQPFGGESQEEHSDCGINNVPEFNVVVGSAIEPTVVYRKILECGFSDQEILDKSDQFDCVLASCVADINMDGVNEILLGTYGQELLVYKLNNKSRSYCLSWQKSLAHPILSLDYTDITEDGLKELLVLSVKGLHILQHDLDEVADLCLERIKQMTAALRKDDTFKALQSEDL